MHWEGKMEGIARKICGINPQAQVVQDILVVLRSDGYSIDSLPIKRMGEKREEELKYAEGYFFTTRNIWKDGKQHVLIVHIWKDMEGVWHHSVDI